MHRITKYGFLHFPNYPVNHSTIVENLSNVFAKVFRKPTQRIHYQRYLIYRVVRLFAHHIPSNRGIFSDFVVVSCSSIVDPRDGNFDNEDFLLCFQHNLSVRPKDSIVVVFELSSCELRNVPPDTRYLVFVVWFRFCLREPGRTCGYKLQFEEKLIEETQQGFVVPLCVRTGQ